MGKQRKWLRLLRTQRGFTQRRLASILGVSTGTVARWERGDSTPRPALQARMATLLDMSAEDLAALFASTSSSLMDASTLQRPVLLPAETTDREVYVLQLAIKQLITLKRTSRSAGLYVVTRSAILRWACALLQVDGDPQCRMALREAITELRRMPSGATCQVVADDQVLFSRSVG